MPSSFNLYFSRVRSKKYVKYVSDEEEVPAKDFVPQINGKRSRKLK